MKFRSLPLTVAAALVACSPMTVLAQTGAAPKAERQVVTRADQLPRRVYALPKLPSELLAAPLDELKALGAQLEGHLTADLSAFDIQDNATLREMYSARATLAQLRGDWAAVPGWTAKARALQEKAGARLASGVLTDLFSQQRLEQRDAAWLAAEVKRRYGAMPWADVQEIVKISKGGIETYNPELVRGAFQAQLDTVARNGQMSVPGADGKPGRVNLINPRRSAQMAGLSP